MTSHLPVSNAGRAVGPIATARPLLPLFGDMRSHARMQLTLSGSVTGRSGRAARCVTRDISKGGAAFSSARRSAIGETLKVRLDGLDDLKAEVARVYRGGFAVTFQLAPEQGEAFANRLEKLWSRSPLSLLEVSLDADGTIAAV